MTSAAEMWHAREGAAPADDIVGFSIEATDGRSEGCQGKRRDRQRLPDRFDGTVDPGQNRDVAGGRDERIDYKAEVVHVNRSKDNIKSAPSITRSATRTRTIAASSGPLRLASPGPPGSP